jgi:NADPH-dependent glutamate synthase beta subunit-like oxidoreductase/glutamate synthase domain-containing protein 3/ferredoxin
MIQIDAKGIYYRLLNRQIREYLAIGRNEIEIVNVLGQRYIGAGVRGEGTIIVKGTPGQDLGAFMNGLTVHVHGNAQDGVGNTMNSGKIVVHGKAGEIPGHSMRGGKIFIRGDVEYRAGIHMKEYREQVPWLVIGGSAKDYCGEYMAGGRVVVLNLGDREESPVGSSVGTGIHGGAIYLRGKIEKHQLGIGAVIASLNGNDRAFLEEAIGEFSRELGVDLSRISFRDFIKITMKGKRPFASFYTPMMNIQTHSPRHLNLTPPCTYACPSGIPTPVFLNLIRDGKLREAQLLMDEFSPFRLSVCGTVCPAPCMQACSRNLLDGPLDIPTIAREYYPEFMPEKPREKREELVSVIGAGPGGLSAAWQLARRGYKVEVYDSADDLGGKLRRAIPRERLSDETLERDLERIRSLPIQFKMKTAVDAGLFKKIAGKSSAVLIATGAYRGRRIEFPGSEAVRSGLEFLVNINEGRPENLKGKRVLVIGAGNAGMDVACESWRMGASKVTAIDVQKPLAFGKELAMAQKLGTEIFWPRVIERIDGEKAVCADGSLLEADVVFFSIGEAPDTSFLPESVLRDERGYVTTGEKSFKTSDPKIFASGDIVKPGLVTDAIGMGRLAAMEMHAMITGKPFIYPGSHPVSKRRMNVQYFGGEAREIDRCMSCGTCVFCDRCIEACPQKAICRNGEIFTIDPVLCTGCYTCVNVCPRSALQKADFEEFARDGFDNEG